MLKIAITRFLQHLISQNQWAKPHLQPFASKTVCLDFVLIKTYINILEDGSICMVDKTNSVDASIHAAPSLLLRVMAGDEAAKTQFSITGNTQLAAEFGKVLQNMRWDIEDDLSKITGDITANKTINLAKKTLATAKQQGKDVAEMLTEYWQEEKPILAKKYRVEKFNAEVDVLKSDVARLEKRLQKLFKSTERKSQ